MHYPPDLPTGYYLRSDSDILILRRSDGSIVSRFSGADPYEVRKAAEQDYLGNIHDHESPSPDAVADGPYLQVRFFGHFEVLCNDEPVDMGRDRKALAIFKYLLAHRDRWVSRDHLMEWLWPKVSPEKARRSLNVATWTLRKRLSDSSLGLQNYILLEDGYYRVCPTVWVETDVDEFDLRYEEGRRVEKTNRIDAAAEFEKAVELYRDDYLLECLYEDWTMVERERLSNAYIDMLDRLAVHYMESGQPKEAIRTCYRTLAKDRYHEESYRVLMRCFMSLGLRERAIHQYHLLDRVLSKEYGTGPSSETEALFNSILQRW